MKIAGIVLFTLLFGCAYADQASRPPATVTVDAQDNAFGLTLPDPYRWMEGRDNKDFNEWLLRQGAFTREQLDASPRSAVWKKRLRQAAESSTLNRLQHLAGERLFFLRLTAGKEGALVMRERTGKEKVLFDPNIGDYGAKHASVTVFSPSPDGKLVGINVDTGGAEVTKVIIINVDTGQPLPETFEPIWGEIAISWTAKSDAFSYTQMDPDAGAADPALNMRVRFHRLGTPVNDDPTLLVGNQNPTLLLDPHEFPVIDVSSDSPFAVATIGGARPARRVCVTPIKEITNPQTSWRCVANYSDDVHDSALRGESLYLTSFAGHANGRVLKVDLDKAAVPLTEGHEVISETDAVIADMAVAPDALYVKRSIVGVDHLLRLAGGRLDDVQLPLAGSIGILATQAKQPGALFTLQDFTHPRTAFRYDAKTHQLVDLHAGATSANDYSDIEAVDVEVTSEDGTKVPLTIVRLKNAKRDGQTLTIVEGYGGYGINIPRFFDTTILEWVKAGHIYAFAHVRGGSEKGYQWWQDGRGPNKHKGVEDFVACARFMTTDGWATPSTTAGEGASMGGILVGNALTAHPEAFGAISIHAGELNPVRLSAAINGANQYAELGDPTTSDGLHTLAQLDPYLHVKQGVSYPAVLLVVGVNDSRVSPWQSGKFAAKLQADSSSGKPVWIRTDTQSGHMGGDLADLANEWSDTYTFLEEQLRP
jgi:prolyl oligopeptidase